MKIAYFISNHGYGHIMRNLAVIAELMKNPDNQILLVTAKRQMDRAHLYLKKETGLSETEYGRRLICLEQETDPGLLVKPGTLIMDREKTRESVEAYLAGFPKRIRETVRMMKEEGIDGVVCDLVPWALTAAKEAGLPSCLLVSFTWIEQFENLLPEESLSVFYRCFEDADQVYFYEMVNEPTRNLFPKGIDVGFCARPFHEDLVKEIRRQHEGRTIVLLSAGGSNSGIEGGIDVSNLPFDFISTGGFDLRGENVTFLPENVENAQDYVAASDYCISKAGWSTLSEMMLAGKPMALLGRPDVPEDTMNIAEAVHRGCAMEIAVEELADMGQIMKRLTEQKWEITRYENQYLRIAERIEHVVNGSISGEKRH